MNIWQVLQITRTNDKKIVKRAYAKLLKLHKPELDPEGYQHLRSAYDKAIDYCKRHNKNFVKTIHNDIIACETPIQLAPCAELFANNSFDHHNSKAEQVKKTEHPDTSPLNDIKYAIDELFSIESSQKSIEFFTNLLKSNLLLSIKKRKSFSMFAIEKGINWDDEREYPVVLFNIMANTFEWFDYNSEYEQFSESEIKNLQLRIKVGLEYQELIKLSKQRTYFSKKSSDVHAARLVLGEYRPKCFHLQAFLHFNHSYNAIKRLIDKFTQQYSLTLCPQINTPSFRWWQKRLNRHAYSLIDVIIATVIVVVLIMLNDKSIINFIDLSVNKYVILGTSFLLIVVMSILISWTINTLYKGIGFIILKLKIYYDIVKYYTVHYWQGIKYRPLIYYSFTSLYLFIFVISGYLENTSYEAALFLLGCVLLFIMLEEKIIILCIAYIPYLLVRAEVELVDFPLVLNYVFVLIALLTITGFDKLQQSEFSAWITSSTLGMILNICIVASLVSFTLLKSLNYILLL